ncbi:MAG: eukaryotic-like serine/threonine-protein kinase, partial [Micromonosporaceae bacterium]|nr:eukaryotic-like serine/threonine-protein kinase [Micromonosporaceae bacterium]
MTAIFGVAPGAFPDLELISELGRGADTVVYRVRRQGRDYALKLMTRAGGDRALTAIRREAALMGCVGHPLLPKIFEVGQVEAGPYLILEYIDGPPLSQVLQGGVLDAERAVRLAIDVLAPLAAAHRVGLVHRDVKPDNVIVCSDNTARLIDFGLAARGGSQGDRIAGTLLYSAPEQAGMLKRPVDGRSDLYALGVLLFQAVTGQLPYRSSDAGELIRLHATAPIPDPRALRPDLSPPLAAIIATLMAKDPDDRYQTGESLLDDLHALIARPAGTSDQLPDRVTARPGRWPPGRFGPQALVGRDNEVVELANRWLKARLGDGGAVVVQGPAGVGKSRLVRELTGAAAVDGDLVLYGKCVPDDPVPLAPLRTAVERYLRTLDQLPGPDRELAVDRVRRAAGPGGPLLNALSPMLASLVGAPDLGGRDRHEQFTNAVAAFLVRLAIEWEGAILHLDDVQWLDGPTRRVLQQVATVLPTAPLLVVGTGRDDVDNRAALARFDSDLGGTVDTRMVLGQLGEAAVAELVALHLGGVRVADAVIGELVARVGGNPFTIVEYVRAVVDAGLITPWWGGWRLDLPGLNRLELTGDALDLVLKRIDGLGAESRRLLTAGAATGRRFQTDLVAMVCGVNPRQGRDALAEAEVRRLVTASGAGGYRFLHDRIREALLAGLDPVRLRRLHQRIAEVLEAADPRYVYAIARHYALGEIDRDPRKAYASGLAAGRLALADHAPAEAVGFLEVAGAAADRGRIAPEPDFFVALGTGCNQVGRFAEALRFFDRGLRGEPEPLRRARILTQIAWAQLGAWDPAQAFESACRGLSELGRPLPRRRLALLLSTVWMFAVGLAIGATRIGFGTARGRERERLRLQALCNEAAGYASTMQMNIRLRGVIAFRSLYAINKLGPGTEYTRAMAGFGLAANVAGLPRLARRIFARASAVAADLGDPVVVAHVEWERGAGQFVSAADDGQAWAGALTEHERWLELGDYLTGISGTAVHRCQDGRTRDAAAWYERGRSRLGAGAQAEGAPLSAVASIIAAQFGHRDEAAAGIEAMRRFLALNPHNRIQIINLFTAQIVALVERGELGEPFERVVAEFRQLKIGPKAMLPPQRIFFVYQAFGRLAQCHRASREERAGRRAAADRAVGDLGAGASNRTLRAYHGVARADLALLAGHPETALRLLSRIELSIMRLNAPLVGYEAALVRARALRALGEPAQAQAQAGMALMLAVREQWAERVGSIRAEFGLVETSAAQTTVGSTGTAVSHSDNSRSRGGGNRSGEPGGARRHSEASEPPAPPVEATDVAALRRRLAALQQVSMAAATNLDQRDLARVVLDETVRIL